MNKYIQELQILSDKVDGLCDESWEELSEEMNYPYHPDTLAKSVRGKYGGVSVYKYFLKNQDKYASDEQIKKLEQIKDELYIERTMLQDANREKRNILREEARFKNIKECLQEKLDLLEPFNNTYCEHKINSNIEAVALLGDIHYGMIVDNVKNLYNKDVAKERLITWKNKLIKYLQNNNVNTLHLCLQADFVSGLIHLGQRVSQEEDVIDQTIEISEILSNLIVGIKDNVKELKIYGVVGNHDRVVANKNDSIASENFARLIYEYIKIRTGINVIQNGKEDFVEFNCSGKKCILTHGDKDSISNAKQHFCDLLDYKPNVIYLAHVHHMMMNDDNGTEIVVNGSVISTDDYAMSLRKHTEPYQIMQIFNENDVITYKIMLEN